MESRFKTASGNALLLSPEEGNLRHLIVNFSSFDVARDLYRRLNRPSLALLDLEVEDFDGCFSPWKAKNPWAGQPDFGGKADLFLKELFEEDIPEAARRLPHAEKLPLLFSGYSLAGLFTLYATTRSADIPLASCVSPSFWYEGFLPYLKENPPLLLSKAYFSIGKKEYRSKNPVFASAKDRIREVQGILTSQEIVTTFEENEGNHFVDEPLRLFKGISWLLKK